MAKTSVVKKVLYGVLGCVGICVIAALLFPVFAQAKLGGHNPCLSNMKQLDLGLSTYENDFDQRLPEATIWMDALVPYTKQEQLFHCPSMVQKGDYGYAFHETISMKSEHDFARPQDEIVMFDSPPLGRNAATTQTIFPSETRHRGQNVGFADGHVRPRPWLPSKP